MSVRFTMSIGKELNDFVLEEAKRIGISRNSYIAMCVENIRNQKQSMIMTSQANDMFKKIEEDSKA